MSTRQDYLTAVGLLVGGELPLGETEKIFAIGAAVKKYSGHRPRIVAEDEAGTGGFDYALTLLEDWLEGFSVIKTVEYPVDDTDEAPDVLTDDAWRIYLKPAGKCLRFLDGKPATTETFRVTYTAPPQLHRHGMHDSHLRRGAGPDPGGGALLRHAGRLLRPVPGFRHPGRRGRPQEQVGGIRSPRGGYRKLYYDHLGIKEGETPAGSVTRGQVTDGSWGSGRMTHGRRIR
jgi:hypothetical protein